MDESARQETKTLAGGQTRQSEYRANAPASARTALAIGKVLLTLETFRMVKNKQILKGDVLSVAEVTGIFGAKQTSSLFAYCNPNIITDIKLEFNLSENDHSVTIQAFTKSEGPVGVEMESMTAVSIACLAIYDMCRSVDTNIRITDIQLVSKTGGQHGDYRSN